MATRSIAKSHKSKKLLPSSSDPSLVDQPLGKLLEAVMAHPDTPAELYNVIGDGWWACPRGPVCNSSELFQVLIDWSKAHPEEDSEPKGGAQ